MENWSSGCPQHGQSPTATERLRLNSGLSDLNVVFHLHMVHRIFSVSNQHLNGTSRKDESGKERVYHFVA